jgi:hypothetical protein
VVPRYATTAYFSDISIFQVGFFYSFFLPFFSCTAAAGFSLLLEIYKRTPTPPDCHPLGLSIHPQPNSGSNNPTQLRRTDISIPLQAKVEEILLSKALQPSLHRNQVEISVFRFCTTIRTPKVSPKAPRLKVTGF